MKSAEPPVITTARHIENDFDESSAKRPEVWPWPKFRGQRLFERSICRAQEFRKRIGQLYGNPEQEDRGHESEYCGKRIRCHAATATPFARDTVRRTGWR